MKGNRLTQKPKEEILKEPLGYIYISYCFAAGLKHRDQKQLMEGFILAHSSRGIGVYHGVGEWLA